MEEHIKTMIPLLNEKQRRLFLASLANTLGRGGLKLVCEISGFSPHTVIRGKQELADTLSGLEPVDLASPDGRIRKVGGGRTPGSRDSIKTEYYSEGRSMYGGYNGKLLFINLTNQTYEVRVLPENVAREYIGGPSLGTRILFDEMPANTPLMFVLWAVLLHG